MAQVYDWLGDRMGRDIFFYTISLDPANDTPADLKVFRDSFGIDRGWTFLTGQPEDIDVIRHKLGERSRSLSEHRTDMVIGNARTGVWRRSSVMGSLAVALESILELDPDRQTSAMNVASGPVDVGDTSYDLAAHPGDALFLRACASCHTIGEGVRHAPDLAAVTVRRDSRWLRRFLTEPDIVLAEGDPVAVALDEAYPGIRMPNFGLGNADVDDLLAYLAAADQRMIAEHGPAPVSTEAETHSDDHDHE